MPARPGVPEFSSARSRRRRKLAVTISLFAAIVLLGPQDRASPPQDACALLKPEEISKAFGDVFGPPTRQATPAGPYAGASVMCPYKGKALTLHIGAYEYPSVAKRDTNWSVRRSTWPGSQHAVELSGIGDGALYTPNKVWSYRGLHEYTFGLLITDKDWKSQLVTIAKLFYSRLQGQ
jgi:hypothetical protein